MRFAAAFSVIVLLALPAGAAEQAPQITSVTDIKNLPTPLPFPYPYNEAVDADAAVEAAFARARANGKRVLIDLGGNWCADCRILSGIMELPELKPFIAAHYEVVTVNVGRFKRNLQIPQRFGITKLEGVPAVIIADADGTPVNVSDAQDLADARSMTPQAIADWLARWAKPVSE